MNLKLGRPPGKQLRLFEAAEVIPMKIEVGTAAIKAAAAKAALKKPPARAVQPNEAKAEAEAKKKAAAGSTRRRA